LKPSWALPVPFDRGGILYNFEWIYHVESDSARVTCKLCTKSSFLNARFLANTSYNIPERFGIMDKFSLPLAAWFVFVGSALLEVGGDAVVRKGLKGYNIVLIAAGGIMLASYGLLVNTVRWDFSKLLGVYVAVFAIVSILCGKFLFGENIPPSTWLGLAIIIAGGLVIQFGRA